MKAIYTIIGDKIWQIEQEVKAPIRNVELILNDNITQDSDVCQKVSKASLNFTDFNFNNIKSNRENYNEMVDYLKENSVTEIDKLYDRYTISIDYTMYNGDKEIEHSVIIKPIHGHDFIYPLGVNNENECVYRRIKRLHVDIDWVVTNKLPFGIMCTKSSVSVIKINDVSIYQDKKPNEDVENHNSIYSQKYRCGSCTINTMLENKALVYSTNLSGVSIQPIANSFNPRILDLSVNIDLTNIIVVYNDETINSILTDNIKIKEDINKPDINDESDNQDTLQKTCVYEMSDNTNSLALKVVEDLYPEENFDENTMVHKSDVIEDIPTIEVGDYVVKTRVL